MSKKTKIFLCDMVHNYIGAATYMFPLNIGYLAAYANKEFGDKIEVRLFKYPDRFLEALSTDTPDIVGFSNYTWNADINMRLSEQVKERFPSALVVFGGPNINYFENGIKNFFRKYGAVDYYVPYQGEIPFTLLLEEYFKAGADLAVMKAKKQPIDGIFSYDAKTDAAFIGKELDRIKEPDVIPSPYTTGVLDEFFDTNLIPIVETNRGCPYQCTFCAQGCSSHNSINYFSLNRVYEEFNYIADRVKNTNLLNLADSNFGIVERDIEISRYIADLNKSKGYPRKVSTNWAKNQPKIFEIAKILDNISLVISLQSLDETVLKNCKRSNIKISVFKDIVHKINELHGVSGTEVILALPGETKSSHIDTLKQLFDWDVSYIICYNALVLDGTEMARAKDTGEFKCKTKFRLIDSSFGKYNGFVSFESEEGIRETDSMSEEDILFFRPVHWLIQFLWNYRFYYELLMYIKQLGVNPLDYILALVNNAASGSPAIKELFKQFKDEAKNEWHDSPEKLREHYSQKEHFQQLKDGLYGKMNGKYIFKVLAESKEEFEKHLLNTLLAYSPLFKEKEPVIRDLIAFHSAAIIDFSHTWDAFKVERGLTPKYDINKWRKLKYKSKLEELPNTEKAEYAFNLPDERSEALKKLLKQYEHPNLNVTLRKMSEFMSIKDFFYEIADKKHK